MGSKAGLSPCFHERSSPCPVLLASETDPWTAQKGDVSKLKPWNTRDFAHVLKTIVIIGFFLDLGSDSYITLHSCLSKHDVYLAIEKLYVFSKYFVNYTVLVPAEREASAW